MNTEYHIDDTFKIEWQKKILRWYKFNKRDLPWRKKENQTFYRIWISEVMLQQTQVSVAIPFYNKFLKKWPTLEIFFDASLDDILKMWQGMGYYKRAHNLFKAKEIIKKNPNFKININSLKKLPGIGDYISSSILAILKDEQCAVVDGNIRRILTRVFNFKDKNKALNSRIHSVSSLLAPQKHNGNYCQSLMDLANLICKVKNPICSSCPILIECKTKGKNLKKNKKFEVKKKIAVTFILNIKGYFLVEKNKKDLLQNLFCFPMSNIVKYEDQLKLDKYLEKTVKEWMHKKNINTSYKLVGDIIHKFSHFHLKVMIVKLKLDSKFKYPSSFWLKKDEIDKKPISRLMEKVKAQIL